MAKTACGAPALRYLPGSRSGLPAPRRADRLALDRARTSSNAASTLSLSGGKPSQRSGGGGLHEGAASGGADRRPDRAHRDRWLGGGHAQGIEMVRPVKIHLVVADPWRTGAVGQGRVPRHQVPCPHRAARAELQTLYDLAQKRWTRARRRASGRFLAVRPSALGQVHGGELLDGLGVEDRRRRQSR